MSCVVVLLRQRWCGMSSQDDSVNMEFNLVSAIEITPGWAIITHTDDHIHVLPIDDMITHEMSDTCSCGPTQSVENNTCIVLHNSLDGRETRG